MESTKEVLRYLDIFGTKFNFYSNKKKIYYTTVGGILTLTTICICLIAFFFLIKDDVQRISPDKLFFSDIPQKENKVKLKNEKLFIPWRVINKKNNHLDNNELINPVITYYYYENETIQKSKIINYRLCNEMMMENPFDVSPIGDKLNGLYCIDNTDIELFSSSINTNMNYINIDFYINKNKINNLSNCYIEIEIYFPEILFEPTNFKTPANINYKKYSYNISKYSTKITKIFLQKNILSDDKGWFKKSITEYSYLSISRIIENSYFLYEDGKIYSISINIETNNKKYVLSYKKIYSIISEGLPIISLLFAILKQIAIILKTTEENRKLVELLFENLKEKKNKLKETINKKINDINNNINNKKFESHLSENANRQTSLTPILKFRQNFNFNNRDNHSRKNISRSKFGISPKNLRAHQQDNEISFLKNNNTNSILLNILTKNNQDDIKVKSRLHKDDFPNSFYRETPNLFSYLNGNNVNANNNNLIYDNKKDIKYVPGKLFPYKYYLFLLFFKSIDISKNRFCFPKKFIKVNLFLGQLLDISTYILLQREFHTLKNKCLSKEEVDIVERNNKINIGSQKFIRMVNECIQNQKFHIFDSKI